MEKEQEQKGRSSKIFLVIFFLKLYVAYFVFEFSHTVIKQVFNFSLKPHFFTLDKKKNSLWSEILYFSCAQEMIDWFANYCIVY